MSRVLKRLGVREQRPSTLASVIEKSLWWRKAALLETRRDEDDLNSFCDKTLAAKHNMISLPCVGDEVFEEGTPLDVVLERLIEASLYIC